MELEWLKKNLNFSVDEKKRLIEPEHAMLSISRQCELLGLSRASYDYRSEKDESYNLRLMNLIDEQFTRTPFYG
jgi:putative transposase